jgi:hypothetical protein
MNKIGKQHEIEDDRTDPSGFLREAREHQSNFRLKYLNLFEYDKYGNYLAIKDAEKGLNFYDDFGIFDSVKRYSKFNKNLYQNMLRSEHIPFNIFIPLDMNKEYLKNTFNNILDNKIKSIDLLKIEYAPEPKEIYLNDKTSFDVYVEYTHIGDTKGIIGIEIKYTEREYKIGLKEKQETENMQSKYYVITEKSNNYREEFINRVKEDNYRQIWRNHLLGESILINNSEKYKDFVSITIFPIKNKHFQKTSEEYKNFLKDEYRNKCLFITYESFFELLGDYCPNEKYRKWIDYLNLRYIIK